MDNHTYNLLKALTKKAQVLWRYEQYLKDASGCEECKSLWEELKDNDEKYLLKMKNMIQNHLSDK